MRDWIKQAFAVDTAEPLSSEQQQLVARVAKEIVRRRLSTPALAFLEMSRPLNYLGAQALHFFAPIVTTLLNRQDYESFSLFLERRDSIDHLCREIESQERLASEQVRRHPEKSQ